MRNEPPREVSNDGPKASDHLEPRGGSAGNGGEVTTECERSVAPNGEIGTESSREGDVMVGPDLATNLKDNGSDTLAESEVRGGPNGEIGIEDDGESDAVPGPAFVTKLKDNGAEWSHESERRRGPNGEIGIDITTVSERSTGPDLATILKDIGETRSLWLTSRVHTLVVAHGRGEAAFRATCEALGPSTDEFCDFITAIGQGARWSNEEIFYCLGAFLLKEKSQHVIHWGHA